LRLKGATIIRIEAPPDIMRYVVEKGHGSRRYRLTVTAKGTGYFCSVVNYTWENTILSCGQTGM
jgi:hypothetical protein